MLNDHEYTEQEKERAAEKESAREKLSTSENMEVPARFHAAAEKAAAKTSSGESPRSPMPVIQAAGPDETFKAIPGVTAVSLDEATPRRVNVDKRETIVIDDVTSTSCISEALAKVLGLETNLAKHCLKLALTNIKTMDRKQKDYGPHNLARHGRFGVVVRLDDKVSRIANLLKAQEAADSTAPLLSDDERKVSPNYESRLDSWLDAVNYSLIGAALETGVTL